MQRRPHRHNRTVCTNRHLESTQVTRLRAIEVVSYLVPAGIIVSEHAHVARVWLTFRVV